MGVYLVPSIQWHACFGQELTHSINVSTLTSL
jgi:hypothetical protein